MSTVDDTLLKMQPALDAVRRPGARLVIISADRDEVRTTLLQSFAAHAARLRRPRPRVLLLNAPQDGAYRPLAHAALASAPGLYRRLGGERQARDLARSLALDWLAAIPVWGNVAGAIGATVATVRRRKLQRGLSHLASRDSDMEAIWISARARPLILCIDDAEDMSRPALSLLIPLLTHAPADARLLIVLACAVHRMAADSPIHEIHHALPPEIIERIVLTRPDAAASTKEFARLQHRTRHLLRAAAALPEPFAALTLSRAMSADHLEAEDRLVMAERVGILEYAGDVTLDDGASSSSFRFTSAAVRETAGKDQSHGMGSVNVWGNG